MKQPIFLFTVWSLKFNIQLPFCLLFFNFQDVGAPGGGAGVEDAVLEF